MRSNPRRLPEEAHSSLDESSYEVLGESVFETSDDEGHTESLASTEGHTPDDVSSISDGDEFDDDYMDDASQHFPPPQTDATDEPFDAHQITSPDDSTFTELADKEASESHYLKLEETSLADDEGTDACGLIKEFDQTSGLPHVLQGYGCPEIRLTVRMALSQRFMPVSRSFRILYVGDFPDWAEKDINRQIGVALDAPPSSSRYNIVLGQLEPSGPALYVDHCTALKVHKEAGRSPQVLVTLDDGTQLPLGPGRANQRRSTVPFPNLVIFCHETSVPSVAGSVTEVEKFHLARNAFKRHQIPSLDIAVVRPFGKCSDAFAFDANSLRLCVEGRQDQHSGYETQETLPIDVYEFIKIEPSQLNRHLACISSCVALSGSRHTNEQDWSWNIRNILPGFMKDVSRPNAGEWLAQRNLWMIIVALTAMIMVCLRSSALPPVFPHNVPMVEVESSAPPSITLSSAATSFTVTSQPTVPSPSSVSVKSTPRDLTVVASEERASDSRRDRAKEEKVGSFEIQATGDYQFVLRPSKHFAKGKRKPHLHIQVSRDSVDVPVRYTSTSGGVYVVDLEQEYSLASFDVSIVARSKPLLQQSFEIRLGSNKSKFSHLMDNVGRLSQTVKHDMALAQLNLRNLSTTVSKRFQTEVVRIEDGATAAFGQTRHWTQQIQDSTQSVTEHLQKAKKEATRQLSIGTNATKDIAKTLRRNWQDCTSRASELVHVMQGARMPDLWKLTAPVRTWPALRKAQRNALQLRTKLGKAGKSASEDSKEKTQSRHGKGGKKSKQSRDRRK